MIAIGGSQIASGNCVSVLDIASKQIVAGYGANDAACHGIGKNEATGLSFSMDDKLLAVMFKFGRLAVLDTATSLPLLEFKTNWNQGCKLIPQRHRRTLSCTALVVALTTSLLAFANFRVRWLLPVFAAQQTVSCLRERRAPRNSGSRGHACARP
jgi:hypothetical protein